ncbi:MAG: OsmC family protein [Moheibacter sp.]
MPKVTAVIKEENFRTVVATDDHWFITDEPMSVGGKDLGADPGELLSAALAACSAATMRMYANHKQWNLEEVRVEVDFKKNATEGKTIFTKEIQIQGNLTEEQKQKLYEIGGRCPIHKTLANPIEIKSKLVQ